MVHDCFFREHFSKAVVFYKIPDHAFGFFTLRLYSIFEFFVAVLSTPCYFSHKELLRKLIDPMLATYLITSILTFSDEIFKRKFFQTGCSLFSSEWKWSTWTIDPTWGLCQPNWFSSRPTLQIFSSLFDIFVDKRDLLSQLSLHTILFRLIKLKHTFSGNYKIC